MNSQTYFHARESRLPSPILLTTLSEFEWVVFLFLLYWNAHLGLMKPLESIGGLMSRYVYENKKQTGRFLGGAK
jgi:hypothetical protein